MTGKKTVNQTSNVLASSNTGCKNIFFCKCLLVRIAFTFSFTRLSTKMWWTHSCLQWTNVTLVQRAPATSMLHFLSLNVNSVSLNLSTQHAICAAGVQAVFWEHNKHTTSQREGSDTNWWMKRLYMHVGGEEHEILFWVYLNTIYISHMTWQFKTEKGGELPEYLPGNVNQTHPSTFRWLVQIQATPQRKQSHFHERPIQQLMSCTDQSVFCWADVENKKKHPEQLFSRVAIPPEMSWAEQR